MQFNTFISSIADLDRCANAPNLSEVLLEPALLARQGKLSEDRVQTLATEAVQRGLRPVLVWDILMPERVMKGICDRIQNWDLSRFAAIRVCDPGAADWLTTYFPQIPLQLIVETGNHNLESLRGWCEIFDGYLERLILSIELPEEKLIEYCQTLPVACELLGVGQILLFYSPRSLLAKHLPSKSIQQIISRTGETPIPQEFLEKSIRPLQQTISKTGETPIPQELLEKSIRPLQQTISKTGETPIPQEFLEKSIRPLQKTISKTGETPIPQEEFLQSSIDDEDETLYLETTAAFEDAKNRHFPIVETASGTFMFLDKDQFILDKLERLQLAGLHTLRLDLRHLEKDGDVAVNIDTICHQVLNNSTELRANWPREIRAPFFKANRTTALFPRMKSKLTNYRNDDCLAEVLAGEKGKYVVFYTKQAFEMAQIQTMIMPTGEAIAIPVEITFRNLNGDRIIACESEQILVTDWIKKAVPGSLLLGQQLR